MENSQNNSRIAKNTLLLYFRMLLLMAVSLYTSRVVLSALGVEDYGIYNVVGGVVLMFTMLTGSLSTAISRFITFELGKGNKEVLARVFSMSLTIQMILTALVVLLIETIGFWYVNHKMIIPVDRLFAANCVFHISVVTFAINLLSVPYNAAIIAYEKMSAFASISIVDASLKLIVAYIIKCALFDKLVLYGLLLLLVGIINRSIYVFYCRRHFEETSYHYCWDKDLIKKMLSFGCWNFIGSSSAVLRDQGVNLLINNFSGPVVNAARGIAMQVSNAVTGFVSNFMVALTPQITMSYSRGDTENLLQYIYKGSKFSFFLLYILSLPILVETESILSVWLVEVPDTTVWFIRYILIYSLADTYLRTLIIANNATGDIKIYQMVIGSLNLLVLPGSYLVLKLGGSPESTVLVTIFVAIVGIYPRIYFVKKNIPVSYSDYTKQIILPTLSVVLLGSAIPCVLHLVLDVGCMAFIINIFVCFLSAALSIFFVGCTVSERNYIVTLIKRKIHNEC
ncbi:MAG: lipopolysaccharide biosynthesis protein [Paludibacteraceae bacterium]|nr:lipopolysaccharide biosynthesis protein [Paludibacteraceae bacterium]